MKTVKSISFFLCTLGIIASLTLFTNEVKAQCPTCPGDVIAPTGKGVPWVSCSTCPVEVNIGGCTFYVCYCWRSLSDWPIMGSTTIQAVVTSIDSIPGCASSLTTQTIIDGIADGVNGDVVGRLNANQIPPCSGSFPFQKLELRIPACMKLVSEGSNRKGLVMCNETSTAYCEMICDLCHNGSVIDRINCIHTLDGTPDCGGGSAPTNFSDWSLNTCYQIPCGTE